MGDRLDRLEQVAAGGAAALSLIDRFVGWWRARAADKAEAKRVKAFEEAVRTRVALERWSDDANRKLGAATCTKTPGCQRPVLHSGDCGSTP